MLRNETIDIRLANIFRREDLPSSQFGQMNWFPVNLVAPYKILAPAFNLR